MTRKKLLIRTCLFICSFVVFCIYSVLCISIYARPFLCSDQDIVCCVEGRLIYDSSFSSNKNHLMTIFVEKAQNTYGNVVSARGVLTVVSKEYETVTCFEKVRAYGKVSDLLFVCDSFEVVSKPVLCHIREFLIKTVEKRLLSTGFSESSFLSAALILGRSEDSNLEVKSLAKSCGCLHVLALSGMHLNVLKRICEKLFGKKKFGKLIAYFATTFFVFVAGPRPSLVRALLMFYFSFLPLDERVCLAFLVQIIVFPLSVINIGSIYGYLAVFGIVFVSPYLTQALKTLLPSTFASLVSSSVSAILFTAPVSLFTDKVWYPAAVLASCVCSVFVVLSMAQGFLVMIFGNISFLKKVQSLTYSLLKDSLSIFSKLPQSGLVGYLIMLFMVFLVFFLLFLVRRNRSSHLLSSYQVIK